MKIDLIIQVLTAVAVVFVTCVASNNIAGFIWTVPLLTLVLALNLYYLTDFMLISSIKIGFFISVIYSTLCLVINHYYLNWYLSEHSEAVKIIGVSIIIYLVLFYPILRFFKVEDQ